MMTQIEFVEQAYEIAFGDDAIRKGYGFEEVIAKLMEFSDDALKYEEAEQNDYRK